MLKSSRFWSWRCSPLWVAALGFVCLISILVGNAARSLQPETRLVAQTISESPPTSVAPLLDQADYLFEALLFEDANTIYRQVANHSDPLAQGWGLNGQARVARKQGQAFGALDLYQQALDRFRDADDRAGQATVLHNMGYCLTSLGERSLARDHYVQALDLYTSNAAQARTRVHIATLEDLAGNSGLAAEELRRTLGARLSNFAESPARRLHGKAVILDRMASAISRSDPEECARTQCLDRARRAFSSSLEISERLKNSRDAAITRGNLGWLALRSCVSSTAPCDLELALDHFESALESEGLSPNDDLLTLPTGKVTALRLTGRLDAAQELAEETLATLEESTQGGLQPKLRLAIRALHQPLWTERIAIEIERHRRDPKVGHAAQALTLADRSRARGLRERLAVRQQGRSNGFQLLAGLRTRMNDLEGERLEILDRLRCLDASQAEAFRSGFQRVAEIEAELRGLELDSQDESSQSGPSPNQPILRHTADLDAILEGLDSETAVLFFQLGEVRSFLFWLDGSGVEIFDLPARPHLEPAVRRVHQGLARKGSVPEDRGSRFFEDLDALTKDLLAGVAHRLRGQRLLIVPDGVLHTLPMAALPHPNLSGELLVESHEIVTLPSLAVWLALRERSEQRERDRQPQPPTHPWLVVVADALYSGLDHRLADLAIEDELCDPPSPLPATAEEARLFESWVPAQQRRELRAEEARREALSDPVLSNARLVHLALHGVLAEERPGFSHLVFSRFDRAGRPLSKNRVFTHEIEDLSFEADLMVLSACEVGLGQIVRGEGLVGMTHSLLAAGVDRVLISLWPVDDSATLELMTHYYRALFEDTATPPLALARAQRAMIADPRYSDPYYWAGFVFVGDWHWPGWPTSPIESP